jgi:hypothetical protein
MRQAAVKALASKPHGGGATKLIPKDTTDRLENEWRQIVNLKNDTSSNAANSTRPADHVHKMAVIAIAHSERKLL